MNNVSAEFRCGTVAIIGRPNVGKSTLLNHLVGQKVSITSNKAQTTRHRIIGILTDERTQFLFMDTPGFQKTHDNALNRVLNHTVSQAVSDADVAVFLVEALRFGDADAAVLRQLSEMKTVLLVVSKCDKVKEKSKLMSFLKEIQDKAKFVAIVPVSVKQKKSLDELKNVIRNYLPLAPAVYGP